MALVHADFVKETTTTTGTGTLSLAGATPGHRTFVSAIGNGNTCVYAIASSDGYFESGIGTITDASPDTLARTTLLSSSTGSKLDLPAGTHTVYCTFAAEGGAKAYADYAPAFLVGTSLKLDSTTLNNPAMTAGFVNRTDTSLAFASNTFTLTKVNNFRIWANSAAYHFTVSQAVAIPNVTGFYYIYFNTSGVLVQSTPAWDLTDGTAPVATLYYNATNPTEYVLSDERHSYQRNPIAHKQQHLSVGTYWISGLSGTFGDTDGSMSLASGAYADEDLVHTFSGTTTQARLVYRDASGWRIDALASDIRKIVSTEIQYDTGTLAPIPTNNHYVAYWVYATNAGAVHVVVGQAEYASTALATAASPDTLALPPWIAAEGRLLYRVIYQRTNPVHGGDIYLTPTDYRQVKISGGVTLSGSFLSSALSTGNILYGSINGLASETTLPAVGATSIWFGDTAPTDPVTYPIWWDTRDPATTLGGMSAYAYFNDGSSTQWVPLSAVLGTTLSAAEQAIIKAVEVVAVTMFGAL